MVNNYNEWKYYNHALVPNIAPHITPNLNLVKDKKKFDKKCEGGKKHYQLDIPRCMIALIILIGGL